MPKSITFRSGASSVLFWSIISAAFIGPGTVTSCALAGSRFGLDLLWALGFSTLGTIILQEAAARITIGSGKSLGEMVTQMLSDRKSVWPTILFIAVAIGCAAYQAGNILGAVSGLKLIVPESDTTLTIIVGILAIFLLNQGTPRQLANLLGLLVWFMGLAFAFVAFSAPLSPGTFVQSVIHPKMPADSLVLIIGLIGTTIVPYNLFLASGIGQGQSLSEMRWGISLAVLIGGLISIAILVSGTLVAGAFTFEAMAATLATRLDPLAGKLFAFGLFAAGFTSALTAPLAASIAARTLLGWASTSLFYRLVWLGVMVVGLTFGLLQFSPVSVILLAQAVNGLLLPFVTIFLLLAINNRRFLPEAYLNSPLQNVLMFMVVGVTSFLGLRNLIKAGTTAISLLPTKDSPVFLDLYLPMVITVILLAGLLRMVSRYKQI